MQDAQPPATTSSGQPAVEEPETKKRKQDKGPAEAAIAAAPSTGAQGSAGSAVFDDPDFVKDLLGSLPGVDMDDAAIQEAIRGTGSRKEDDGKKDEKDKKE